MPTDYPVNISYFYEAPRCRYARVLLWLTNIPCVRSWDSVCAPFVNYDLIFLDEKYKLSFCTKQILIIKELIIFQILLVMCRTCHALLQTFICSAQMFVRIIMLILMMIENLLKLFLQTFYNFCSIVLQIVSLLPVCLVFLLTSRIKCLLCGGSGACAAQRSGRCDCVMSLITLIVLFFILKSTGHLDKALKTLGYTKSPKWDQVNFEADRAE